MFFMIPLSRLDFGLNEFHVDDGHEEYQDKKKNPDTGAVSELVEPERHIIHVQRRHMGCRARPSSGQDQDPRKILDGSNKRQNHHQLDLAHDERQLDGPESPQRSCAVHKRGFQNAFGNPQKTGKKNEEPHAPHPGKTRKKDAGKRGFVFPEPGMLQPRQPYDAEEIIQDACVGIEDESLPQKNSHHARNNNGKKKKGLENIPPPGGEYPRDQNRDKERKDQGLQQIPDKKNRQVDEALEEDVIPEKLLEIPDSDKFPMPPSLNVLKGVQDAPDCRIIIEDQEKKKRRREEQIGEPRLPDIPECVVQYTRTHEFLKSQKEDGKFFRVLSKNYEIMR